MKTIGKIITGVLDGIAKVLGFLLISLGLWLPALFTIGFFIVCGAAKIALTSPVLIFFWIGLGVTAVLGFVISMRLRAWRKRKEAERSGVQPVAEKKQRRKRGKKEEAQPSVSYAQQQGYMQSQQPPYMPPQQGYMYPPQHTVPPQQYMQQPYSQPYGVPPQQATSQPVPPQQNSQPVYNVSQPVYANSQNGYSQQQQAAPSANGDFERKYFSQEMPPQPERYERTASFDSDVNIPQPYGKTMSKTQERAADSRLGADELWRRLSGADVPDEKPLVFRTRRDPDVYVYEYSDRYQYWRRTKMGMVFERTEYKSEESRKRK